MSLSDLLLMRNELMLISALIIILIADLFYGDDRRNQFYTFSVVLVFIVTVVSFIPQETATLFGGMYHVGPTQMVMKAILNLGTFLVLLQASSWLNGPQKGRSGEFILLLISTLIGMGYMVSSQHFLMFFLGLELATIPLAALAAFETHQSKSAEAGIKFILLAAFSSGVLLFGLSMIYALSGSMYFEDVMLSVNDSPLAVLGLIFFISGLAFKISIVPFHLWTADVYEGAPISVTAYLSVVSKGAAVFILLIVLHTVFISLLDLWFPILYVLIILTITLGNLFALRQSNVKRFLAFSSIAQAGFILLGFINTNALGPATVIYFVLIYVFSNLAAFGVATAILDESGKQKLTDYKGFYDTNPKLSLVMMLAMFSLAGIPPVAGFFGKFFLFTAVAEQGYYVLVLIAVINSIVSLYYYLLVVKAMFIDKSESPIPTFQSNFPMKVSLVICVIGIVSIGFYGGLFDHLMEVASHFVSVN